jgi:hypothetical protein
MFPPSKLKLNGDTETRLLTTSGNFLETAPSREK